MKGNIKMDKNNKNSLYIKIIAGALCVIMIGSALIAGLSFLF